MAPGTVPPPVSWAQRSDVLYIIIDVECKDIDYSITENSFVFKGTNALEADKKYEVTLNFLHSVNPKEVTVKNIGRCLEFTIVKASANEPYWKSLTNDKTKLHFLKANFNKWKNESDDEESIPGGDAAFGDIMSGSDFGTRFDDFPYENDDDSDDSIPSLSQNDEDDEDKEGAAKKEGQK